MNILELFSGTGSFSKVCEERGYQVFTIDISNKFNPSLCKDIHLIFKEDIPFIPDVVWASPPCQEYSHAKRRGIRDLETADTNVIKAIELIALLKPRFWIIENPQTSLLKDRDFMRGLSYTDVSYCKYGMPYRKQTRLWNNFSFKGLVCNKDCNSMNDKKHIGSAGNGRMKYTNKNYTKYEKYVVPKDLCLSIIKQIEAKIATK